MSLVRCVTRGKWQRAEGSQRVAWMVYLSGVVLVHNTRRRRFAF